MKHPEPSAWMSFLYGESSRAQQEELAAHLAACPDCSRRVQQWRGTMGLLDAVGAPERPLVWRRVWSSWPRVAAAALILGLGIVVGRMGTVSEQRLNTELASLRDRLQAELGARQERDLQRVAETTVRLTQSENRELLQDFLRHYQATRAEDREEMFAAFRLLDERRAAETATLREGLVQLAAGTGTGFEETHSQMRFLTSYLPSNGAISETTPTTKVPDTRHP